MGVDIEVTRLSELEAVIERGQQTFIEVGRALTEIRDSGLYRTEFATFEEYCKTRWGWERQRAYQLISASDAVTKMSTVVDKEEPIEIEEELPPVTNERQARELAKIKNPKKRKEVWRKANKVAEQLGEAVTTKL